MSMQTTTLAGTACQIKNFEDRQRMDDALASQKALSGLYNTYLSEAYHTPVKNCLSGLLKDVHRTQEEVFDYMYGQGWYQVEMAEEQKVTAARQKFDCFH